jgi:outer membrane protein assembly factor BamA
MKPGELGHAQVYNVRQAKQDIDAVYSMGLFDDVNILPQPAEDSSLEQPKVSALKESKQI